MATLTLEIPDPILKRIEVSARNHGHTLEQESAELLQQAAIRVPAKRRTRAEVEVLIAKLDSLRESMGVTFSAEEIDAARKEGREE